MVRVSFGAEIAFIFACLGTCAAQTSSTAAAKAAARPAQETQSAATLAARSVDPQVLAQQINRSSSEIDGAQARTEALLARLIDMRDRNPESASRLNLSIESLQALLAHLRNLNVQADTLRNPHSGIVASHHKSQPPLPTETTVAQMTTLSADAQSTQAQAEQIAQAATETSAARESPASRSGESSGSTAMPPPAPTPPPDHQQQQQQQQQLPKPEPQPTAGEKSSRSDAADADVPASMEPPETTPPSDQQDPESAWFAKLKSGLLQYSIPTDMKWKVASTVSVVVNGAPAAASTPLPGQTVQAPVKVSRQMRVIVSCPDNPDEFTIAPESGTQEVQFVPEDGATTWNYSVTPRYTGPNRHLRIQVWVVYATEQPRQIEVYNAAVAVHVPGFGESLKRLVEGDPDYWLKYGLPGGAGFVFVSGAIAGLRRLLKKKQPSEPPPVKTAS